MPDGDADKFGKSGTAAHLTEKAKARLAGESGPILNESDSLPGKMDGGGFSVNVDELRGIIQTWAHEDNRITEDGSFLTQGAMSATEPAVDPVSAEYVAMLRSTLGEFVNHNRRMGVFSTRCVENLGGSMAEYYRADDLGAMRLRGGA